MSVGGASVIFSTNEKVHSFSSRCPVFYENLKKSSVQKDRAFEIKVKLAFESQQQVFLSTNRGREASLRSADG